MKDKLKSFDWLTPEDVKDIERKIAVCRFA